VVLWRFVEEKLDIPSEDCEMIVTWKNKIRPGIELTYTEKIE